MTEEALAGVGLQGHKKNSVVKVETFSWSYWMGVNKVSNNIIRLIDNRKLLLICILLLLHSLIFFRFFL